MTGPSMIECTRTNMEFDLRQGLGKGLQKTGTGREKMLIFGRTHIDLGLLLFTFFVLFSHGYPLLAQSLLWLASLGSFPFLYWLWVSCLALAPSREGQQQWYSRVLFLYWCTRQDYWARIEGGGRKKAKLCSGRVESTWAGLRTDRRYPLLRVLPPSSL